jgi:peroxiredoxin
MVSPHQPNLLDVDWSKIPAPADDGAAAHLVGMRVPDIALAATTGVSISLAMLKGRTVLYAYPRTGVPGEISPVDDWDMIPGARGCTPQSCAFRDHFADMRAAGVTQVFGLSTQDADYQREMAARLHLPFLVLSDSELKLSTALRLPTMRVADMILLKRMALVIDGGVIVKVFYPVFPPDRNASDVLAWIKAHPKQDQNP